MSSPQNNDLYQQQHLKKEWIKQLNQGVSVIYQHRYCEDQAEVILVQAVSMKQLDIYSSRECYSFPFCPRLYRYSIISNVCLSTDLVSQVRIFVEYVSHRLNADFLESKTQQSVKWLLSKMEDIVKGFRYLFKRFGPFKPHLQAIGWTDTGLVKVWINANYSLNIVSCPLQNEEAMIKSLVALFEQVKIAEYYNFTGVSSFETLLQALKLNIHPSRSIVKKQVGFKISDSLKFSNTIDPSIANQTVSRKARRNITLSHNNLLLSPKFDDYTTKSICNSITDLLKPEEEASYKINLIDVEGRKQKYLLSKSESVGNLMSPIDENKRNKPKLSQDCDETFASKDKDSQSKSILEKLVYPISNSYPPLNPNANWQQKEIQLQYCKALESLQTEIKEELQEESYKSFKEEKLKSNQKLTELLEFNTNGLECANKQEIRKKPTSIREFQISHNQNELQNDLDALFNSSKSFNNVSEVDLEKELDGILF